MGQNKDQFKSGVLLSYLTLAISSLLPFLYTPIVLRILGQNEYGLYSLANTAIGYLSLLTFGFGSTILRYLSIYRARGEKEQEQKVLGFFLLLYGAIAVLTLLGGSLIATHADTIFKRSLSAAELEKIRILLLLITANAAVALPIGVLSSVVMAHERYLFRKMVDLGTTLLLPCANLTALFLGYASVGMAVASMIVQIALLPIYGFYCRRILRIRPIFARIPGPLLREIVGISAFVFLGAVVDMLFWSTDKLLLGMLLGTASVAVYNIGATFNSVVMNLSGVIVNLLSPRITGLVAKDADERELTEHFIRVGRLQFLIVALIVSGFAVFGRSFVRLWAGDEYGDAYWIAILTMFPLCIPLDREYRDHHFDRPEQTCISLDRVLRDRGCERDLYHPDHPVHGRDRRRPLFRHLLSFGAGADHELVLLEEDPAGYPALLEKHFGNVAGPCPYAGFRPPAETRDPCQ